MIRFVVTGLFVCFIFATVYSKDVSPFKGITVLRAPFVEREADGKLKGYFVDLLDELAKIGKFNYTLEYLDLPTSVPGLYEHTPNGLINELYRHNADFAIADFLIRSNSRYVSFTEPYIVSELSALVRKCELTARNISTIKDLLEWKQTDGTKLEEIKFGTIRSSSTYRILSMANDQIGRRVYRQLYNSMQEKDPFAIDVEDGINRVLKSPYAFIQGAINNELAMDENCQLTQLMLKLDQTSKESQILEYAIVVKKVPKGILDTFNRALSELKKSDQLEKLRHPYWNRKCNSISNGFSVNKYSLYILLICFLFGIVFN